jgi:hypothetical protein
MRNPHPDVLSRLRPIIDEAFFPGYYKNIRFAALTMDERGLQNYGPCTIVLRSTFIADRSSVFDGNTLMRLLHEDPPLSQLVNIPSGHRALWSRRGSLALSAFGRELILDSRSDNFPKILLETGSDRSNDRFIEVHIWGIITSRAIESVKLTAPSRREDRVYARAIQEKLTAQGVRVSLEEVRNA